MHGSDVRDGGMYERAVDQESDARGIGIKETSLIDIITVHKPRVFNYKQGGHI